MNNNILRQDYLPTYQEQELIMGESAALFYNIEPA